MTGRCRERRRAVVDPRSTRPRGEDERLRGRRCGRRTLDEFVGQPQVREQLSLVLEGAMRARPPAGPHPAGRPARPRQDHARDDRRRRARHAAAHHQRPGARARRRPGRAADRADARARCSSSTRSTGSPGRPRSCSTRRWRTSGSTSSLGKGPGATAIPLDVAPFTLVGATTRAGLLTGPLRDRFGFTAHMDFYYAGRAGARARTAPRALLGVPLDRRRRGRDRRPLPRHATHRQPAAAPGPRLRRGQGRRAWSPSRSPGRR